MSLYREIKQHFHIPNAFTDWKEYRNTLTDYLIHQTDSFKVSLHFAQGISESKMLPSLLVIGAGACNDLDLARLVSYFSNITLLDYDKSALETAIANYHLEQSSNITLSVTSLNGFTDSDYQSFCEELSKFLRMQHLKGAPFTPESFDAFACTLLEHLLSGCANHSIPLPPKSYDFIWCFGVHSQLQAMFSYIYRAFQINLQEMYPDFTFPKETGFENMLKEENNRFIPVFHDAILRCARQKVFIGLEANRASLSADGLTFSSFDTTPVEGAYQGLIDLERRNLNLQKSGILWPFRPDDNIYYQMQIEEITLT